MIEIPKESRKAKEINPRISLFYGPPKSGKTTITSYLEDHLILELEEGGADYIEGRVMELYTPADFNAALKTIATSPTKVCEYLIVDSITKLDDWSEIVGTYKYMQKVQGQSFNRVNQIRNGEVIEHTDPRFESVHELGQGYGYQHSRNVMTEWYDTLLSLITSGKVGHVIMIAHLKDKMIETKKGDMVETIDINLTGKVKAIYASRVDALGYISRKEGKCIINFQNDKKAISGGRCSHLDGEIVISEKNETGKLVTHWDKIFIK